MEREGRGEKGKEGKKSTKYKTFITDFPNTESSHPQIF